MRRALLRIAAVPDGGETRPSFVDWFRALLPFVAPFSIVLCAPRGEMILVAACWGALILPGVLAVNLFFPPSHPLGRGVSRLGVASIIALFPFGVLAWTGCMLHWTLSSVLVLYALVYLGCLAVLAHYLARRPVGNDRDATAWPAFDFSLGVPRWSAVAVLVGIGLMMFGVCKASPPVGGTSRLQFVRAEDRPDWWHGTAWGASGSVIAAVALTVGLRRGRTRGPDDGANVGATTAAGAVQGAKQTTRKQEQSRRKETSRPLRIDGRGRTRAAPIAWDKWLVAIFWLASAGMTLYVMKVTYSVATPEPGLLPWDVDDVAYVSEAVDYAYGHTMGKYEPSIGSDHGLSRAGMSPLTAPLVATISRVTGVSCAALHHSVMPPLVFLVGTSCMAAALMVVFRMHRWAVPLGLLVVLVMVFKSWDYARCEVEMIVYRAMQTKALQLWVIHPLQLATLVLLVQRPTLRHLAMAAIVAAVGHGVHPLATIMGMVWFTAASVVGLVAWRGALPKTAMMLALYCALGGEYYYTSHRAMPKGPPSSGRVPGSPIQSRDLVRVESHKFSADLSFADALDVGEVPPALLRQFAEHGLNMPRKPVVEPDNVEDGATRGWFVTGASQRFRIARESEKLDVYEMGGAPIPRHDPFWAFGNNTLYHAAALSVPIILAFGWRRREIFCVGVLGAAILISCNYEPLGRVLNIALPTSIFWRARWMLPSLANMAILAVVLYWAVAVILRRRDASISTFSSFAACLVAVAAFAVMVGNTTSNALAIGQPPKQLSKFSDDMHGLVELLGGTEASPFVWGLFQVHHELPQLMPNIKLVFSRDKFMRVADDPNFRNIAMRVFVGYQRGQVAGADFKRLLDLYPIDHVVLHTRYRATADFVKLLEGLGWQKVGRSGIYEVWRIGNAT